MGKFSLASSRWGMAAGLALACGFGGTAAAGESGAGRGKTTTVSAATAAQDAVRPENRLIARLLTTENPDFEQLADSHPDVANKTLKQIRSAFDKKDRNKALLALYEDINAKEIVQAGRIWNRAVGKLATDEGRLRSELARAILVAFGKMERDKAPSKDGLAEVWRSLMDEYYEMPLVIGGIGIERDRLDEALRRDRRKGLELYLEALDRQEVEGRMLLLRGNVGSSGPKMAVRADSRVKSTSDTTRTNAPATTTLNPSTGGNSSVTLTKSSCSQSTGTTTK